MPVRNKTMIYGTGVLSGTGPPIIPDYPAWFISGGITPSSCLAAYRAKGAMSQVNSYINLANPGVHDIIVPTAHPTWDIINGWSFDDTLTQYLLTDITGLITRQNGPESFSILVRFSDSTTPTDPLRFTTLVGGTHYDADYNLDTVYLSPNNGNGGGDWKNKTLINIHDKWAQTPEIIGGGVMGVAGTGVYVNGEKIADMVEYFPTTDGIYLPGMGIGADPATYGDGSPDWTAITPAVKIQAVVMYTVAITASQVLAVTNAMNEL